MSWVTEQQAKLIAEERAKQEKAKREAERYKSHYNSDVKRMEAWLAKLKEVENYKGFNGETVKLKQESKYKNYARLSVGDKEVVRFSCQTIENERYDSDGCSFGDGTYSEQDKYWVLTDNGKWVENWLFDTLEKELFKHLSKFIDFSHTA
jgi:hypothetical protein